MPTQSDFIWKGRRRGLAGLSHAGLWPVQGWLAPHLPCCANYKPIHKSQLRLLTVFFFYELAFKTAKMLFNHCSVTEQHSCEEICCWFFRLLYMRRQVLKGKSTCPQKDWEQSRVGGEGSRFPGIPSTRRFLGATFRRTFPYKTRIFFFKVKTLFKVTEVTHLTYLFLLHLSSFLFQKTVYLLFRNT